MKQLKLIIAGTRQFDNYKITKTTVERVIKSWNNVEIVEVVCGECRGPDLLGKRWALNKGIKIKSFPADWEKYGRAAGPIRNKQMVEYANAAIVFWDGRSRGTKSLMDLLRKMDNAQYCFRKVMNNED